MADSISIEAPWWRGCVIYQIYPRSFLDTDGNPMTHDPKDPSAAQDNVPVGGNVAVTLK